MVSLFYRADKRSLEKISTAGGFKSWQNTTVDQARAIAKLFVGGDESGLPEAVNGYLKEKNSYGVKNQLKVLGDMSIYIKYTKDNSTTWVSTAVNSDCGGQSGGAPIYRITVNVLQYKISNKTLVRGDRTSAMFPTLLLDQPTIDTSNVIALLHGPIHDAEASFLTPIPMLYIDLFKAGTCS